MKVVKTDIIVSDVAEREERFVVGLPFVFLVLFALYNFLSPHYYIELPFSRLAFFFGSLTLVSHIIVSFFKRGKVLILNTSLIFTLIVLLFAYLSIQWAIDVENSVTMFSNFFKAVVLFVLIYNVINTYKEFKIFIYIILFGVFFNAYEYINSPVFQRGRAFLLSTSVAGDPNGLSMLIVYTLPLIIALIIINKSKIMKILLMYFTLVMMIALVIAKSRGGFVALVTVFVMTLMEVPGIKKKIFYIVLFTMIIIPFYHRYVGKDYIWRMEEIIYQDKDPTGSIEDRKLNMLYALDYTLKNPISEYGIGNHSYMLAERKGIEYTVPQRFTGANIAHNIFLQVGADLGFIPMIFYLLFILSIYAKLIDTSIKLKGRKGVAKEIYIVNKALRISLVGFLAGAFFLPVAYRFFLFYISGLCVSLNRVASSYFDKR